MCDYERTRAQIRKEIKNRDLQRLALQLADAIERMSNISSNGLASGIHSYDKPELAHMIGGVFNFFKTKRRRCG
jgi:hypothetical protein